MTLQSLQPTFHGMQVEQAWISGHVASCATKIRHGKTLIGDTVPGCEAGKELALSETLDWKQRGL